MVHDGSSQMGETFQIGQSRTHAQRDGSLERDQVGERGR